ncbi:MAG: cupin domain-containing protein [Myxococcales bacterium]|nr:cupin domain-containing protein [Myxococcales bacterium]
MLALTLLSLVSWAQEQRSVVVTAKPVAAGAAIARADLYTARLDPALVPEGTFGDPSEVAGRIAREPMLPHALVRAERLAEADASTLDAALPSGFDRVRLPRITPSAWPTAGDRIDVVRLGADGGCLLSAGARVLAAEDADGDLHVASTSAGTAAALHLAVRRADAGAVGSAEPERVALLMRGVSPDDPSEDALVACHASAQPVVRRLEDGIVRMAPDGTNVKQLLRGRNAFLGELRLPGGSRIPAHRDATEEYLWVLEGKGTITIDGTSHYVEPGSLVYMPARAKVSYVNGPRTLVALQVFAGPEPAAAYEEWGEAPPPVPRPPPVAPAPAPEDPP